MAARYPTNTAMSTSQTNLASFDELRWVINIRQLLEDELQGDDQTDIPVCIFNVPSALMSIHPDCYVPQIVAIGPYHYWRPELHEMERYKLSASRRMQEQLQCRKFETFVHRLMKYEHKIRACYHKYLNFNAETLTWMMAIDASFLIEFLQIYLVKEGNCLLPGVPSSQMRHLVDYSSRKFAYNAILRDILMLENQIPLFVIKKMLEIQFGSLESADDLLVSMLMGICRDLCPFVITMDQNLPKQDVSKSSHLLDFLYQMVVPKMENLSETTDVEIGQSNPETPMEKENETATDGSYVKQAFVEFWKVISAINKAPIRLIKSLLFSRALKFILKMPWKIVSNLPGFSILKNFMGALCSQQGGDGEDGKAKSNENCPPSVDEIAIPSVTELTKSGVRFVRASGPISSIEFNPKDRTLCLPPIILDVNSEVFLRNLVAYEASSATGPLVFTRYTELMTGIIDTAEDVKILRGRGILTNRMKSDGEAAELWNGMSKSIRLTKVAFLDEVIENVNKFYNGRWIVKGRRLMKSYVYGSWQCLTLFAAISLLALMTLQAFCSVYGCSRVLRIKMGAETAAFSQPEGR